MKTHRLAHFSHGRSGVPRVCVLVDPCLMCDRGFIASIRRHVRLKNALIALSVMAALVQTGDLPFGAWSHTLTGSSTSRLMAAETETDDAAQKQSTDTTDVESFDGTNNNLAHPTWGSAGTDLLRIARPAYADGIDAPSLPTSPSPRLISNLLNSQADPANPVQDIQTVDENSASDFGYAFGQFMDHDLDLSLNGNTSFPIAVPAGDPIGPDPLPFTRSLTDPATGTHNPAQQVNAITSYFDLSQIYGSSPTVADAMRTFADGLLKTSPGNMLPYNNSTYFTADQLTTLNMANDSGAVDSTQLFATGDRRGNENLELTTLETLFVRNHNLLASELGRNHPNWTDEELYQEARKLNIAVYQNVVYNEWIPAVLGPKALPAYKGYNPSVNASVSNEFSTVAYRFGHSMVSPTIAREGNNGLAVADEVPLAYDFFDPNLLSSTGAIDPLTGLAGTDIGPVLKGEADGNGQAMDLMAIEDIRNLLFGNGGFGGQDLMALDVQRGRDHGIPDYNTVRAAYGLAPVTDFSQISRYASIDQWEEAYPGGLSTVDAFEGGLGETHVAGSDVGPLFQAIMVDQFRRLRDGDRFFYMNEPFVNEETHIFQVENSLAKIIMANTNVSNLQAAVISFKASISGTVNAPPPKLAKGATPPAITVELEDTTGDVLATTDADAQGRYTFDQLSGPSTDAGITPGVSATGLYPLAVLPPTGLKQSGANPPAVSITKGDTDLRGINFSLIPLTLAPPVKKAAPPKR
jgi:peroxidase